MPSSGAASKPETLAPPPLKFLLFELRVLAEFPHFIARAQRLRDLPRGDGHAVLVIPGFGLTDSLTLPMRRALDGLGYQTFGWELGRNLGMSAALKRGLARRLQSLSDVHGPVSLIGWSLGGVYAREMARQAPAQVRRVFTLGSPINIDPEANNVTALFKWVNRRSPPRTDREGFEKRREPPPVSCVALYTRSDGIVAWPCSREPDRSNTENVEVAGSHLGLIANLQVFKQLAMRLPAAAAT